ncbi:electron transport complex subunit RsxG [Aestuariibacter sp. AA17]|uniref:Ion-translocating oxidoreductase complex subunit G n=1 Tax=Fluctibacter corallii TaxID=2984329 RepID=A0ABT3AAG9_9ALTE|nr:electron transport complex subunit RsxG [Aestuariibacter sp. AA17]MCV2885624.1 electron transport complex subunit RsxG [Aestuariibacter sp. AA17]
MAKKFVLNKGLILGAFALVCTGLVTLTFALTKDTIQAQQVAKVTSIINQIVPNTLYDNDMTHNCAIATADPLLGKSANHKVYRGFLDNTPSVLAIESMTSDGYSGNIYFIVGVKFNGTVTGVRVLEHKETPGLGDKIDIRISDWITTFKGTELTDNNQAQWAVRKDGGQFDQFTGATITPRAVVEGVKSTLEYVNKNKDRLFNAEATCQLGNETTEDEETSDE